MEFKDTIERLLELARRKQTAVLCAEAVWWRCHRALISDYLKAAGVTVEHIIGLKKNEIHPFTSAARLEGGNYFMERQSARLSKTDVKIVKLPELCIAGYFGSRMNRWKKQQHLPVSFELFSNARDLS